MTRLPSICANRATALQEPGKPSRSVKHWWQPKFSTLAAGEPRGGYEFDTGPHNVFVVSAIRHQSKYEPRYDEDGAIGAKWMVGQTIVDEVLQQLYFGHNTFKTTGRETFSNNTGEQICDRNIGKGALPEECLAAITRKGTGIAVRTMYAPTLFHTAGLVTEKRTGSLR